MTTIGFVGLGNMGAPMVRNLARKGFAVHVFDAKAEAVGVLADEEGVTAEPSVAAAAAVADIFITMLPDNHHVRSVLTGEGGAAGSLRETALVVDMSTISPIVAQELHAALGNLGIGFVDAPVSGGTVGAEKGVLTIMAGGAADHVGAVRPALDAMGTTVVHAGGPGMGQLFKLCNQIVCVGNLTAISEALSLCRAGGGDASALLEAMAPGSAGSWMLDNLAPRMVAGEDAVGFPIDLQLKDLRLVGEAAQALNVPLPMTALINAFYLSARAHGEGRNANHAIYRVFDRLAGREK